MVAQVSHKHCVSGSILLPASNSIIMGEDKNVKIMYAIYGDTIREIVKQSNELGIQRDAIVSLIKEGGQFILTYYA